MVPTLPRLLVPLLGVPAFGPQQIPLRVEVLERVEQPALGSRVVLVGSLVDVDTGKPVSGATVAAGAHTALSDDRGGFRLEGIESGKVLLTVTQVAYGSPEARLDLDAGMEYHLRVAARVRPIPVDSLDVTTRGSVEERRRASPTRVDLLAGDELEAARTRGETVAQVVKRFPGIRVRYGRFSTTDDESTGVCLESSTRRTPRFTEPPKVGSYPFCDPIPIFMDDVQIRDPVGFLHNLRLDDFEEVQLLPEVVAGARYGVQAGNGGVLLLKTRRR